MNVPSPILARLMVLAVLLFSSSATAADVRADGDASHAHRTVMVEQDQAVDEGAGSGMSTSACDDTSDGDEFVSGFIHCARVIDRRLRPPVRGVRPCSDNLTAPLPPPNAAV